MTRSKSKTAAVRSNKYHQKSVNITSFNKTDYEMVRGVSQLPSIESNLLWFGSSWEPFVLDKEKW